MWVASPSSCTKFVVEVRPPNSLLWDHGPAQKGVHVRWEEHGYSSKMQVVDSQHCSGAVVQPRAIIVWDHEGSWSWSWVPYSHLSPSRPMQNPLTPKGLRPHHKQPVPPTQMHQVPRFDQDPMPSKPMGWIMDGNGPRASIRGDSPWPGP